MAFAVAVFGYLIAEHKDTDYIGPAIAVITMAWSILQWVYRRRSKERASAVGETLAPARIEEAADQLASAVAAFWNGEAAARRIAGPAAPPPVSVRWRRAGGLSPRDAGRPLAPGTGPPPLSGAIRAGRVPASGVIAGLHDGLYARLPRGRLVITGGPGSGKTAAMILLLLKALAWREELTPAERSKVPVPVLLPLAGWDPVSVPLPRWAASVLNRDYRELRDWRLGGDAVSALIGSDRVALFLDGLDEMPGTLRAAALLRIDSEAPRSRIVMTSRSAEFADATGEAPLGGAYVIELRPVQPDAAAAYLRSGQPTGDRAGWERVASYIKGNPLSPAARVLDNPLMLATVRYAYATDDPVAIIDSSSFPTEDDITDHLTSHFLEIAYSGDPRDWRWLGRLARYLDGRAGSDHHDLEWWRLGGMLGLVARVLAVTVAAAAAGILSDWLVEVPVFLRWAPGRLGLALSDGLLNGPLFGVVFGLAYAIVIGNARTEPSGIPLRLSDLRTIAGALRPRNHAARTALGFLIGFTGGLGYAVVAALTDKLYYGAPILTSEAIRATLYEAEFYGIIFGFSAGIAFLLISVLERRSGGARAGVTPLSLLAESRSQARFQFIVFVPSTAIMIVAGSWAVARLLPALLGPFHWSLPLAIITGGVLGVGGPVCYTLAFTAWGQWLLLARVALPLTGRLPWKLTTFLNDAYQRGVLRQAGAVYQFRHLTLQAYLSRESAGDVRRRLY